MRATVGTGWEQAGACTVFTAVQFHTQQADRVDTETDNTLGVAGFVQGVEAQAGFTVVALAASRVITEIAAEIQDTRRNVESTVF
ncbi:hypothetical protein D3C86_2059330 [compost metagenome]